MLCFIIGESSQYRYLYIGIPLPGGVEVYDRLMLLHPVASNCRRNNAMLSSFHIGTQDVIVEDSSLYFWARKLYNPIRSFVLWSFHALGAYGYIQSNPTMYA